MSNPLTQPGEHTLTSSLGLLLLRLGLGLSMALTHGYDKLIHFSEKAATFPDPLGIGSTASLGLAVGAEFLCALLLVIGLFTRLATLPLIVTMLIATLLIHSADPYAVKELAALYLIGFTALALTGPGRLSIDHTLSDR